MTPPKTVVIVGGSLGGLLHGLYLKRHGSDVVILEQDPNPIRSSHQAGIACGPATEEILRRYDATGAQCYAPSVTHRMAYRKRQNVKEFKIVRHLTSWGLLYRILRANFDGLASEAVPNPPSAKEGDGKAEYRAGQRVTKVQYNGDDGVVTVGFLSEDGAEGSLTAHLVIGADGMHSTVRGLMHTPTVKEPEYSGYVAWRGTVLESELPPETAKYFGSHNSMNFLKNTYIVSYAIPSDSGSFAFGTRMINWVWYYRLPAASAALAEVLTDTTGNTHGNTVPAGLVRQDVWRRHLATTLPAMAAPFAALLAATREPLVTCVRDALCETAAFHDGKVVLVGDALAAFRPHLAVATEQAARHCLGLGRVWKDEMPIQQWAKEASGYGKKMWLASRVFGLLWLAGWGEFLKTLCAHVVFLVKLRLGRGPKGI